MAIKTKGHSAKVSITLIYNDQRLSVAQIGNSGILVRKLDQQIPPGSAVTIVVQIDNSKKRHQFLLPDGISEANKFFAFF